MQHADFGLQTNLTIIHSLDITDECPNAKIVGPVLVEFGQGTEGVVCEISKMQEGAEISHPMDAFSNIYSDEMHIYRSWAEDFGIGAEALTLLIQTNAPKLNREQQVVDLRKYSNSPDSGFENCLKVSGLRPGDLMG